jgi:hypothetical protein
MEIRVTVVRIQLSLWHRPVWWQAVDVQAILEQILFSRKERWMRGYIGTVAIKIEASAGDHSYEIWKDNVPRHFEETHECEIVWYPRPVLERLWKSDFTGKIHNFHALLSPDSLNYLPQIQGSFVSQRCIWWHNGSLVF